MGVHSCILVHKHIDLLSIAQNARKIRKKKSKITSFFPYNSPFPVVEINKNQCHSSDFGALCSQLWSSCLQAKEPIVWPRQELSWYGNKEKHWHKKNVHWFALELA